MTHISLFYDDKKNRKNSTLVQDLFCGKLDENKILPYPRLSQEEKERIDLFCHKLRQFSEAHINPVEIDRQAKIPQEVIEGLAKLGMLGLSIPQEYGGLGMPLTALCKALEVVSQQCGSTSAFLIAHSIGYMAITLYGSNDQKQKWLPDIARGDSIASFALTEAMAGSDINAIETKAVYDSEKNVFYLTGKKQWVTNGSLARVIAVIASTEVIGNTRQNLISAFLVTPNLPGFKLYESSLDKIGLRGIESCNIEFDHMEVPAENMLGKPGDGFKIALAVLNYGRVALGAACNGPAKIIVDNAYKYAFNRHQFRRPLSSFALVKKKLAYIAAVTYAIEAVTYFTSGKVNGDEKDFYLEAAMVKVFSTEMLWSMIFETMQIVGGKSMFVDQPYELFMRDCRLNLIFAGSNDVLRMFISNFGMEQLAENYQEFLKSFKSPQDSLEMMKKAILHLKPLFWPTHVDAYSELIKKEAKMLGKTVRQLGRGVLRLLQSNKTDAFEKQIDLERIASAAIYIYASIAVISKLDSDLEYVHEKTELLGRDIETAKFFCHIALKSAQQQLKALFNPLDKEAENLSDLLIEDL